MECVKGGKKRVDYEMCKVYGCWIHGLPHKPQEEAKMETKHTLEECLALVRKTDKIEHETESRYNPKVYLWGDYKLKLFDDNSFSTHFKRSMGTAYRKNAINELYELFSNSNYRKEHGLEKESAEVLPEGDKVQYITETTRWGKTTELEALQYDIAALQEKIVQLQDEKEKLRIKFELEREIRITLVNFIKEHRFVEQEKKPETKDWTSYTDQPYSPPILGE